MSKKTKAVSAGLLCALVVGFSFLGTKIMVDKTDAFISVAWRYNMGFIFMILFFVFLRAKKARLPEISFLKFKSAFLPSLFYVLFMLFQAIGLISASSVESAIAFAIIPVFAVILSVFLVKEKPSFLQIIFMGMTTLALIIIVVIRTNIKSFSLLAMAVLLLSSFCLAASQVYMRKKKSEISAIEMPCYFIIMGFVIFNLLTIGRMVFMGNREGVFSNYFSIALSFDFIIAAAYLGIFCIFLSASLMAYMTKTLPAYQASIFGNLSTVISIFAGVFLLKERFTIYDSILTAIIIIGVIGINYSKVKK
jgi:drug/metabolite transporter (DMT)-like permease